MSKRKSSYLNRGAKVSWPCIWGNQRKCCPSLPGDRMTGGGEGGEERAERSEAEAMAGCEQRKGKFGSQKQFQGVEGGGITKRLDV